MASSRAAPIIIQLVVFYLVISWLVRLARRRKAQAPTAEPPARVSESKTSPPSPLPAGAIQHRDVMYNGVLWRVTLRPRSNARSKEHDVYVDQPPRCPKCRLGVVESESWLGYTWTCPACGLRKRSRRNIETVAETLAHRLH
jgi:hypothetical protein